MPVHQMLPDFSARRQDGPSSLPEGWQCAIDAVTNCVYYFNASLNITQWEPPLPLPRLIENPEGRASGREGLAAPANPVLNMEVPPANSDSACCWCYWDPYMRCHGPFTREQLAAWRPHLPMDLAVWRFPAAQAVTPTCGAPASTAVARTGALSVSAAPRSSDAVETAAITTTAMSLGDGNGSAAALAADGMGCRMTANNGSPHANGDTQKAAVVSEGLSSASDTVRRKGDAAAAHEASTKSVPATKGAGSSGQLEAVPAPADGSQPSMELAVLLGDSALLADWRTRIGTTQPGATAPPASVYEHWLITYLSTAHAQHHHQSQEDQQALPSSSAPLSAAPAAAVPPWCRHTSTPPTAAEAERMSYADAVLAALPPDDEAVVMARLAAAAGRSLQDVVDFSHRASAGNSYRHNNDYSSSEAIRDPRSGRLTAAPEGERDGGAAALYGDMTGWCNPSTVEASLRRAAEARKEGLPQEVYKRLKEQKQQQKRLRAT